MSRLFLSRNIENGNGRAGALGVVVGAGWTSKQTYGTSNDLPHESSAHDISSTYLGAAVAAASFVAAVLYLTTMLLTNL